MHTVKIKNQTLELGFDAASVYRYSAQGGDIALLEGREPPAEKAFACLVTLAWAMLKGKSAKRYKTPNDLAGLFLPLPPQSEIDAIRAVVEADAPALQAQ